MGQAGGKQHGKRGRLGCCGSGNNGDSCGSGSGMFNHVWTMSGHMQSRQEEILLQRVPQIVPKLP